MLPAKEFDFRWTFGNPGGHYQSTSRLKDLSIFEEQLDSDSAFQTLGFRDPSDGDEGGFLMTDEALLQNLEREPFFQLHSRGTEDRPDRSCRPSLLPDNFAEVALSNS